MLLKIIQLHPKGPVCLIYYTSCCDQTGAPKEKLIQLLMLFTDWPKCLGPGSGGGGGCKTKQCMVGREFRFRITKLNSRHSCESHRSCCVACSWFPCCIWRSNLILCETPPHGSATAAEDVKEHLTFCSVDCSALLTGKMTTSLFPRP